MRPLVVVGLLAAVAVAAVSEQWKVDEHASKLVFHAHHKLHDVTGHSESVRGGARLLPDGRAQVEVKAPVMSFLTGNVQRDSAMRETIGAARYPDVILKALSPAFTPPTQFPATMNTNFTAQLTFHGKVRTFDLPVALRFASPGMVEAHATFPIRLSDYDVQRPALMMVKLDDEVQVEADLALRNVALIPSRATR
jgi:polyisoprenoid-binding protein YceI